MSRKISFLIMIDHINNAYLDSWILLEKVTMHQKEKKQDKTKTEYIMLPSKLSYSHIMKTNKIHSILFTSVSISGPQLTEHSFGCLEL